MEKEIVRRHGRKPPPSQNLMLERTIGTELKIIQEVIATSERILLAKFFLRERLAWNYLVAFAFHGLAAFFAIAFEAPRSVV